MSHTLLHFIAIVAIGVVAALCKWYMAHRFILPRYGKKGVKVYLIIHFIILILLGLLAGITNIGGFSAAIAVLVWVAFGFLFLYMPLFCYVIISSIDYLQRPKGSWGNYAGLAVATICTGALIYGAFNRYNIEVTETQIASERLPATFDGYRIVQFSDMHLETLYSRPFAQKVVDEINRLQPHIILFTGDMVNRKATELLRYNDILSQLKARDGVYTVMGNHDYGDFVKWESEAARVANLDQLQDIFEQMGWKLLNNASCYIHHDNDSIAIIGVENWGEPPFQQYGDLHRAYPSLQDSTFKVLLSHNPRHWRAEVVPQSNIDLMLAGHTHALQFTLGNFSPAVMRYPEWGGLYKENGQYLYVNVGIGCTMIPTRIGATPEITLITLQSHR